MSGYLIDTDWIIDVIHGQPLATQTLLELAGPGVSVSLITYGELFEGAYYATDPVAAIAGVQRVLDDKPLLPLSEAIMEMFGIVRGRLSRQLRQQIGDLDLLIAATALTHDLTLVTRNLRDFRHVPDLKLYQSS